MPPTLAVIIGLAFVWYAFSVDRKRGVVVPPGLLWPTLWYMACSSRMLGFWLSDWGVPLPGSSGGDASDGSFVDAAFFGSLTLIGFSILARRRFSWGAALRANPFVAALFIFMALSIVWSGYPYVSFKRYVKVLGSVSMALVVLTNDQPLESMLAVLRRCLYVHLPMSIVCIKYVRNIGVTFDYSGSSHAWQGISTSKNDLGQVAMLGVIYFLYEVRRNWSVYRWRNFHVVYLLMAVGLLKGSEDEISMTSISVTVLAVLVFLRLQALRHRLPAARRFVYGIFALTVGLIVLIIVHSIVNFSEDSLFGEMITKFGRNITLTDRIYIWHDMYAAAGVNPLLGVGYGGFWIGRIANIPWCANMTWALGQGHSGYIDTYLQIGLVGSGLLALMLITSVPRLLDSMSEDFDLACFRLTLFVTMLYVNVTETTFLRGDHHLWFMMMLVIWLVPQPKAEVLEVEVLEEELVESSSPSWNAWSSPR